MRQRKHMKSEEEQITEQDYRTQYALAITDIKTLIKIREYLTEHLNRYKVTEREKKARLHLELAICDAIAACGEKIETAALFAELEDGGKNLQE